MACCVLTQRRMGTERVQRRRTLNSLGVRGLPSGDGNRAGPAGEEVEKVYQAERTVHAKAGSTQHFRAMTPRPT